MRIISWNCRGLGGTSTISQLKESMRFYLPDLLFICEIKQKSGFVKTVCRNLRLENRWDVVEAEGKRGGLLVAWGANFHIKKIIKRDFCVELLVEPEGCGDVFCAIFIYATTEQKERERQWEYLRSRRQQWGNKWVIGGDFNYIRKHEEKMGGRRKNDRSFDSFRSFIDGMGMGEVKFRGASYTWANNREHEGFIHERLDRFFSSAI